MENLLCRYNTINYLKNIPFIKIINPKDLAKEYKNFCDYPDGTVIAFIDDPINSSDFSVYNYNNFLDLKNISFCISEDWVDNDHIKLKRWPIGLESRMFINKPHILKKPLRSVKNKLCKILCNGHLRTYKNPRSGLKDDRSNLIEKLKESEKIDFWQDKVDQEITFEKTQEYNYSLCPEGNGIDTHRFYETYYLNLLPIVKEGYLSPLHSQFPGTVIVKKWEDVEKIDVSEKIVIENNRELVTTSYWLYKSLLNKCKIVNFITGGVKELWKNFLYTVRKLDLEDLLVVFVLDNEAYEYVKENNIYNKIIIYNDFIEAGLPTDSIHKSESFRDTVSYKFKAIVKILEQSYIVFYYDVDIVLFENPIKYYFTLPYKLIYIQSDMISFSTSNITNYCTGIIYVQPDKKIIEIMKNMIPDCITRPIAKMDDQGVFNDYVKNNIISIDYIGCLDPALYPNGFRFFTSEEKGLCRNKHLIHNNYIMGNTEKINRFKHYGYWYK